MGTILSIITFILMLGILIFVHEFGHFITAKKSGVHIHEFAIGMGPLIKTIEGKDGIKYSIRALPIGGFVQMAGEVYEDDDTNKIPKDKYLPNVFGQLLEIVIPLYRIILNAITIIKAPTKPNSSVIIENIKSVCGSGK